MKMVPLYDHEPHSAEMQKGVPIFVAVPKLVQQSHTGGTVSDALSDEF